jgi:hypothetical protein
MIVIGVTDKKILKRYGPALPPAADLTLRFADDTAPPRDWREAGGEQLWITTLDDGSENLVVI